MQRRPVIHRFRRVIERGRVSGLHVSGRLLRLHALPRCAELPRPRQQRSSSPRATLRNSGSAAPSSRRPREPASTCSRPPAGRSPPARSSSAIWPASVPQALVQQVLSAGREFAQCMRSHGVPNWPDPTLDSRGAPAVQHHRPASAAAADQHRGRSNASAWIPRARCWRTGEIVSETVARPGGRAAGGGPGGREARRSRGLAAGWPWASWSWWRPGRWRRGGRGCSPRPPRPGPGAGGARAGDGGGDPAGPVGDHAGDRDAGVRRVLHGDRAGRRDADLAAVGRAGDPARGRCCTRPATAPRWCCCTAASRTGGRWMRGSPART